MAPYLMIACRSTASSCLLCQSISACLPFNQCSTGQGKLTLAHDGVQANSEKLRLEKKQRAARAAADRGDPIKPRWFEQVSADQSSPSSNGCTTCVRSAVQNHSDSGRPTADMQAGRGCAGARGRAGGGQPGLQVLWGLLGGTAKRPF